MKEETPCPCGSNLKYAECCGPLISGTKVATTAEALMRSRYVAYVLKNKEYLLDTWHSSTRPEDPDLFNDGIVWKGLEILRTSGGQAQDNEGTVEFRAKCRVKDEAAGLDEASEFVREDGRWFYVDGSSIKPIRTKHTKIGRNAPCPCGSGKKYKNCCAKNNVVV